VTELAVASLSVTPAASDVVAGGAPVALSAHATFGDGSAADVSDLASWSTSSPGTVDVTGGSATAPPAARVNGGGLLTAAYGGKQGSSSLRVVRGPPVDPDDAKDPLFSEQWYLVNTGQDAFSDRSGVSGEDLKLGLAWDLGLTGRGVKVAIVDDGLDIGHEDLAANVVPGSWSFFTGTRDPSPTDPDQNHGTAVAGIVAMVQGNQLGGMGIASGASLNGYAIIAGGVETTNRMFVQALGSYSEAYPNGPRSDDVWIFNQSYGSGGSAFSPVSFDIEAQYAAGTRTLRSGRGAIYVKSAGNQFLVVKGTADLPEPCERANAAGLCCGNANGDGVHALPYNIVVGALDASGARAAYSSAGSSIWIAAPGGGGGANEELDPGLPPWNYDPAMVTTDPMGCDLGSSRTTVHPPTQPDLPASHFDRGVTAGPARNARCNYTNSMSGTSSAAPSTTGSIALLLDANPDLTWREVKHVLAASARRVDPFVQPVWVKLGDGPYLAEPAWTQNAAGFWFHDWYGFGAVDVSAALDLARTFPRGSLGKFDDTGWITSPTRLELAIPDDSAAGVTTQLTIPRAMVIEAVQVFVDVTHPYPGDIGIELWSPSGTRSVLSNIRNGLAPATGIQARLGSNMFYGEPAAGNWILRIVDGHAEQVGHLNSWMIRVYGH
jgi:subtilisin family serine protease/subtilisin-like proprotein convertase family protein